MIWLARAVAPSIQAIEWTDIVTAVATAAAALGTLATLIFFGLQLRKQSQALSHQREASDESLRILAEQIAAQIEQTRLAAEQTRLQTQQASYVAEQTRLLATQAETESSAAELNFNLDIMTRLQEVLWQVADHEPTWQHVWGDSPGPDSPDCRRPGLGVWALLDVLSMALAACDRLPRFSRNQIDWVQYALDSLHQSPNLLKEALEVGKTYWPEMYPLAYAYNVCGVRDAKRYVNEKSHWEQLATE